MGETRVNLHHLLEDLRDAYPGSLEETIVSEIVANALDSGAHRITLAVDAVAATLTVVDDGAGMSRKQLARYHDLATTTKERGQGIGFAGVGIKLGLLACEEVVTESRRGASHVATSWRLTSKHRAPWRWIPPILLVPGHGTAVRMTLSNPLSPLLDAGFLETALRRHYEPLFDAVFDAVLGGWYGTGITVSINHVVLDRAAESTERSPLWVRIGRQRKPSAQGYATRADGPLPEDRRGIAVSTLGKVIKRGWDWLGVTPVEPDRVGGLIEVPALAECLTLNKGDFIRTGPRGALFLAYRKALQEAVTAQLAQWGDQPRPPEEARRRRARPIEKDLKAVLVDLADEFPLLATLVERQRGGQRRLALGEPGDEGGMVPTSAKVAGEGGSEGSEGSQETVGEGDKVDEVDKVKAEPPTVVGEPEARFDAMMPGKRRGPAQRGRYALSIQFENRPDSNEVARLAESVVWVNEAHPAHKRCGGVTVGGLSPGAGGRDGVGAARGGAGRGARVHYGVPDEVGRIGRRAALRER